MNYIKITTDEGIECVIDADEIMSTSGSTKYAAIHMRGNCPIYGISHDELKRVNEILTEINTPAPSKGLPPITLKDLEPISDAWALVDQLSPIVSYNASQVQIDALIAEHKAVENLLFPPRLSWKDLEDDYGQHG